MPESQPTGILLVDKPAGITSHRVVAITRKSLDTRKVGHAGTLDPMATGLLVLGVGASTRLLTHVVGLGKTYLATIVLGETTVTDDAEGNTLVVADASAVDEGAVRASIVPLTGDILQVPSAVSAVKVDGQRAYALVRAGEEVELSSRAVTVSRFEITGFRPGARAEVDVEVDCSSGTYVRALARDVGAALGVGGHLSALRRTRVGDFDVAEAVSVDDISSGALRDAASAASRILPAVELSQADARLLSTGMRPQSDAAGLVAAIHDGELIGVAHGDGTRLRAVTNFPRAHGAGEPRPQGETE